MKNIFILTKLRLFDRVLHIPIFQTIIMSDKESSIFGIKKTGLLLAALCLVSRILFKLISGYDNFELFGDSVRYDNLSNDIIQGSGDMNIVAYLAAPLYPYTLALIKWISGESWQLWAVSYQFILVSLSVIALYRLALLWFANQHVAIMGALVYIFYPMTLWYNFTLAQETTFQAYFIFFLYFFYKTLRSDSYKYPILAATFWSLALLTKSHIIALLIPLALIFLIKRKAKFLLTFIMIAFLWTIPHGLENLNKHGIYTLSSHGNASLFLLGHSDATYPCLTKRTSQLGEFSAQDCKPDIVFDLNYFDDNYGYFNRLSPKERNSVRHQMAIDWIRANPTKFWELKWHGLQRAILPGLDSKQFRTKFWLLSLLFGLLLYLPAYWILFQSLKDDFWTHAFSLSIVLLCAAIFIVFFPINRFRVITVEPLLCVYAGKWYADRVRAWRGR